VKDSVAMSNQNSVGAYGNDKVGVGYAFMTQGRAKITAVTREVAETQVMEQIKGGILKKPESMAEYELLVRRRMVSVLDWSADAVAEGAEAFRQNMSKPN